MVAIIGISVFLLAVAGAVAFIATRPDSFHVERSARISASPDVVFALINDFQMWKRWSPYEKLDPNMTHRFEGPAVGPGARFSWAGRKAGEGRMTILEAQPGERVSLRLEMLKPIAATNQVTFTLLASEAGTQVSWRMEGENTLFGKAASAFVNMDQLLGKDFERGLADLDTTARAEASRREGALG